MTWIPDEQFDELHVIRQQCARAQSIADKEPTIENLANLEDALARRARAIRVIHQDDGTSVRQLSAMFRCSKTVIREALEESE